MFSLMPIHQMRGASAHEIRRNALRFANDFDSSAPPQNFFPKYSELHLGQPVAYAAMNPETEGEELFVSEVMRRQVDATRDQISHFLAEMEAKASSPSKVIETVTKWFVLEYSKNRGLLRAQMRRALDRPQEWQPFQKIGRELIDGTIRILEHFPDVRQDSEWERRVRVAMQMILGTLNNVVINRPGPLELSDNATGNELSRAAIRYLGWNELRQGKPDSTMLSDVRSKGRKAAIEHKRGASKK